LTITYSANAKFFARHFAVLIASAFLMEYIMNAY
jgi:hypothetical protein